MKDTDINKMTIGEIVAQDYRAASVFKEVGIDMTGILSFLRLPAFFQYDENNILFPKALNFTNQNQKS